MFNKTFKRFHRRGAVVIYYMAAASTTIAFCSLVVDYGRVQLAKTQLESACDATARAAAGGLATSVSQSKTIATQTAAANYVDGSAVPFDSTTDLEFGTWMSGSRTFAVLTGANQSSANAVRVSLFRTASRNNQIPLLFAKTFGRNGCDIHAQCIVMLTPAVNVNSTVQATANPFLAGMPKNSQASLNNPHNSPDTAGNANNWKQSPLVVNISLYAGQPITFATISGSAGNDPNGSNYQPDGDTNTIVHNSNGSENGIADMYAPINAVVGIFLNASQPSTSGPPSGLDFSSAGSRDFTTLQPQLKQVFFIGDGLNSYGQNQQFIVPTGATRLYLATWDAYEWNNNVGNRQVQITNPTKIALVK